jgi:S-formylglutathione hydrolase FrmB
VVGRNDLGAPVPDVPRGNLVGGSFHSPARNGARTGWTICWPHGTATGTPLPVLVMLHGHGSDHSAAFEGLAMDRFLGRAVEDGLAPFAIASVDGGRDYWKPAPDGSDASRMVVSEFVPLLAEHGLDTSRMSIGGWSMGGYGSLRIAGLRMLPVRSVGVFAPALHWAEPADDVLRNPARLEGTPLQISVGRGDLFYRIDQTYEQGLRAAGIEPEVHTGAGAHNQRFWRSFVPSLLRFTGRHLNG